MKNRFGLYLIMTDPVVGYAHCAQAAVDCGVRFVQLRIKNRPRREIVSIARDIRKITQKTNTLFIVNDDVEIAGEADADGVHLGQDDLSIDAAREIWKTPGKIFGLSTHNEVQAQKAVALTPDYIGIGPVFPTPTKAIADPALGIERAGRIAKTCPVPHVVLGGLNETNLDQVLSAGAVNYSAVRPVMQSRNPKNEISRLQQLWRRHYSGISSDEPPDEDRIASSP
ncbi:MAG: thiamine phosphate synthase [Pontiellaceae bacterium]|jgi:thiamine-phosphate pyrophosphorylase|nr:thiamine phosphate synthase [Pontiellaceae bacterium]